MKRFDLVVEISRQLITVASAVLVGLAALSDSIFFTPLSAKVSTMINLVYFGLALSIISGIIALGGVANLVETQERETARKGNENIAFISIFDNLAAKIGTAVQMTSIAISFLFLLVALVMNPTS